MLTSFLAVRPTIDLDSLKKKLILQTKQSDNGQAKFKISTQAWKTTLSLYLFSPL